MSAASRSPHPSDWRDLASLGEQIVSAPSLAAQRDRIIAMTSRLVGGTVDVWFHEELFRLPDVEEEFLFPKQPSLPGMQRALKLGKTITKQRRDPKNGTSRETWAAVPLEDQGIVLGALQVSRAKGPEFRPEELDVLEGLAGVIVVSLIASHRVAVERFRLNQLHLVSEVSAQIANVLNLDELTRRVTKLIQQTFHYYYVAIFTLRDRSTAMRYRASAMSKTPRKGKRTTGTKPRLVVEVEVGQGLIGQAAATASSYLNLPPVLRFFSGNIGFHHIHHFDYRIPNYHLARCLAHFAEFESPREISLWTALKATRLTLWDESRGALVRFDELKAARSA